MVLVRLIKEYIPEIPLDMLLYKIVGFPLIKVLLRSKLGLDCKPSINSKLVITKTLRYSLLRYKQKIVLTIKSQILHFHSSIWELLHLKSMIITTIQYWEVLMLQLPYKTNKLL